MNTWPQGYRHALSQSEHEKWHWYLGTQCLGLSNVEPFFCHAQKYIPQNQLFVCNKCGTIWARIFRESATSYSIVSRHCPADGPGFLLPFDEQWINIMPHPVLEREVLLISEMSDPSRYPIELIFRNTL